MKRETVATLKCGHATDRKIGCLDVGPCQVAIAVLRIAFTFLFAIRQMDAADTTAILRIINSLSLTNARISIFWNANREEMAIFLGTAPRMSLHQSSTCVISPIIDANGDDIRLN